jgi:PhzF family phenazine biosynthesis protein
MIRRFQQVDVFTSVPYLGNPLAVVIDGEGLSDADMQRFANWTNLSETTFLLPPTNPDADYKVRIFTATSELPFAGHPTLGSCHAWLASGGKAKRADQIMQECGVGLVTIRRVGERLAFAAPPLLRSGDVDDATQLEVLGQLQIDSDQVIAMKWADNGPGWIGVLLRDAATVMAVKPRPNGELKLGVVGFYPPGSPLAYEVRGLYPSNGIVFEDPVTGSLNASVAQWLIGTEQVSAPYVARQGTVIGRDGHIYVDHQDGGPIWIGGDTVTCIDGTVMIPNS